VPGEADADVGDRNYQVLAKPNVIMNDIRLRGLALLAMTLSVGRDATKGAVHAPSVRRLRVRLVTSALGESAAHRPRFGSAGHSCIAWLPLHLNQFPSQSTTPAQRRPNLQFDLFPGGDFRHARQRSPAPFCGPCHAAATLPRRALKPCTVAIRADKDSRRCYFIRAIHTKIRSKMLSDQGGARGSGQDRPEGLKRNRGRIADGGDQSHEPPRCRLVSPAKPCSSPYSSTV
jgi:hypothetical protein